MFKFRYQTSNFYKLGGGRCKHLQKARGCGAQRSSPTGGGFLWFVPQDGEWKDTTYNPAHPSTTCWWCKNLAKPVYNTFIGLLTGYEYVPWGFLACRQYGCLMLGDAGNSNGGAGWPAWSCGQVISKIAVPSRELTYPDNQGTYEDDDPFPQVGY